MADFIGGGLPTVAPSAASHSDPNASTESPAPITTLDPPASNPGADDPSAGIAKDAGGASGSAYVGSPVRQEHEENKTVVGAVLETVIGKKERSADEFESSTTTNKENETTANLASTTENDKAATGTGAPGVFGAVAGAAAAGTAAVANYVGLGNAETTPKEEGDKTAASVEKSTAETEAVASEKASEAVESTKEATTTTATTDDDSKEEKEAKTDDDGVHDTSHVGSHVGNKPKQVSDHEAATRENVDAIPTAGGEKLGTAHEGESKIIPDVPPENPEADETKPGQPDKTTADNTAKNVGGAAAPATGTATAGHSAHHDESSPSGKPKFMEKVKAKLHLDKKDKA